MWTGEDGVDGLGKQKRSGGEDAGMGMEGRLCVVCKRLDDGRGGRYVNVHKVDPAGSGNIVYDTGCCFVHGECEDKFRELALAERI